MSMCGPLQTISKNDGGFYDWWFDKNKKKHKGTCIADLERARIQPEKWGVSKMKMEGMVRPPRPTRILEPLPRCESSGDALMEVFQMPTPLSSPSYASLYTWKKNIVTNPDQNVNITRQVQEHLAEQEPADDGTTLSTPTVAATAPPLPAVPAATAPPPAAASTKPPAAPDVTDLELERTVEAFHDLTRSNQASHEVAQKWTPGSSDRCQMLAQQVQPFIRRLRWQLDAAGGTNKNNFVKMGVALAVACACVDVIQMDYMVVGHTR